MNQNKPIEQPLNPNKNNIVEVTNIDHFVALLTAWHLKKVSILQHMVSLPEGTEMQSSEGTTLVLSGDILAGFKAGIALSLMELGSLPFAAQTSNEPIKH